MMYAQTNLQLFNQLQRADYAESDIMRVSDAYRLAMRLYTGWFRASGKPFLAHLVGTASVLAHFRVGANVVSAGLLHAAYTSGEFAAGTDGASPACRAHVAKTVGGEAERLINAYAAFSWTPQTATALATPDRVRALEPFEREILLIRLANELEDHLDLSALYSFGPVNGREYSNTYLPPAQRLADLLGLTGLAAELERVRCETEQGSISVQFGQGTGATFLPPHTYQLKLAVGVAARAARFKAERSALRAVRLLKRLSAVGRPH
jgi:(p)ppGpp synthase/HD superfamily hydrolase